MKTPTAAIATCSRHGLANRFEFADYVQAMRAGGASIYCLCGRLLNWTVIDGTVGTGKCDARCWDSIRATCRCSCGGRAHATTFGVFERSA